MGMAMSTRMCGATARLVGSQFAQRMCVEGLILDPAEALACGFVDLLVPGSELRQRADAWLRSLLGLPREAMLATRRRARADLAALFGRTSERG